MDESPHAAFVLTSEHVQRAISEAGLEVYRADSVSLRVAQRVRMHLMDSGVEIGLVPPPSIRVTVRAQLSDFPGASASELFARVRNVLAPLAQARAYCEIAAQARDIHNPADRSDVLDVWHELTFAKPVPDTCALIAEVRWALGLPKCVEP